MSRDAIERLQTSKKANTCRGWDAFYTCLETVEAVSKWTPKERLQRKPADRELFPGLPLSGFEHVRTFENFSFLKLKVSKRITFKTKASGEGNSTNNFKNFLEPDFILPLC